IPKDIHEKSKECRQNAMDRGGVDDWIIGVGIGSAGELFSQWSWIQCLRVPGPVKEVVKP
ncbi:MAG TPA: hypothetical protein VEQ85_07105, partial [Lacipirellulaceae bacterium]|nr:hypothetical protein [Lacipirellulaceae bacterium]